MRLRVLRWLAGGAVCAALALPAGAHVDFEAEVDAMVDRATRVRLAEEAAEARLEIWLDENGRRHLPYQPHPNHVAIGLIGADMVTTEIGLANGFREVNPLVQERAVRIGLNGLAAWALWKLAKRDARNCKPWGARMTRRDERWCWKTEKVGYVVGGIRFVVVGSNLRELSKAGAL